MMSVKVSIIIVSFNTKSFLKSCLTSINVRSKSLEHLYEIIVVDNDSSDGTVDMIAENFSKVVLIKNEKNLGFGAANNIGFKYAQGEYLLLINPDIIVESNIIEETLNFFANYSNNSAFGGMLINLNGSEQRGSRRSFPSVINAFLYLTHLDKIWKYQKSYDLSWLPIQTHEVDCVSGACLGIHRNIYQQLGGFDERFFMHFEDIDICKRIRQSGYKILFYPSVRLIHIKGGSSNNSEQVRLKVSNFFIDSLVKYVWKWHKVSAVILLPFLLMFKFIYLVKSNYFRKF